jgi:hypothetical protein
MTDQSEPKPTTEQRLANLEEMVDLFEKHTQIHMKSSADAHRNFDAMMSNMDGLIAEVQRLRAEVQKLQSRGPGS